MRFSPNWAFPIILATTCCLANFCQAAADVDLYSFGNWRIVQILTNNSYKLIGGSTGKIPGHFYLQCGADNFLAVGVPIFKTSTTEAGEVVMITVWSADGLSKDIRLIAANYALATQISYKNEISPAVRDFVDTLSSAKSFFAMSLMGDTFDFDLAHFPAAKNKFDQLCTSLSPH
jgi:hypothetical protein